MEYFLKDITTELLKQRGVIIKELSKLNENLPNYGLKCTELNNQIFNIDSQIKDHCLSLKDLKIQQAQNELTIKTQIQ